MITIDDVRRAAVRIAPHVRRTPLVSARALKDNPYPDGELLLKLECLQATGSFKARGATNKLLSLTEEECSAASSRRRRESRPCRHTRAGLEDEAMVYLPESASPEKAKVAD
jgi:threonine dehydratase